MNLNKFALIAYQFHDIHCSSNVDTSHVFHVSENIEDIDLFETIVPCPICQQSCRLNEIYSYQVEEKKRSNSISMRMFNKAKFICSYAGCGKSYPLETIHHHEMFECLHRSILCPAQGCKYINNVESVNIQSINCPFHLLYCAFCKSLYNVSVLTHDCNVI